jgi:hypothetical protein
LLNKKGNVSVITFAILTLLAAGVIVFIIYPLFWDTAHAIDRSKCKIQVDLHSTKVLEGKLPGGLDQCETNYVEVNEDDEEEIKKILADEMYYCWDQFGEGEKDFISEWRNKRWCFICSRIDYDMSVQSDFPTISDFDLYLRDHEFPYFASNRSISFYEYLLEDGAMPNLNQDFEINTNGTTYVMFFADKSRDMQDVGSGLGIGVGGGIALCGLGILASPISGGTTLLLCAAGGTGIVSGIGYAINHHPNFSAGVYIGDAAGAVGACKGT